MAIVAGDIDYHLSGGSANSDVNLSLGGARSSVQIADASLHNLFDVVASAESAAGDTEYRCLYVRNAHGSLTLQSAKVWISASDLGAGNSFAIALAGEGLNGTAETVANESTAPSGETFSSPTTEGTGLSLGDIPTGQHYAIWVRRTIGAGAAAKSAASATLLVKGDTAG